MGIDNDARLVFGYVLGSQMKKSRRKKFKNRADLYPLVELAYASPWYDCGEMDDVYYLAYVKGGDSEMTMVDYDEMPKDEFTSQLNKAFADCFKEEDDTIEFIIPRFVALPHIY